MSIEVARASLTCSACSAQVAELRRGRCWTCYTRWSELRPVGRGAMCLICHERRRDHLRLVEMRARSVPMCHSCAGRTLRLTQVPDSLDELREILTRDRRRNDRRDEGLDQRIFPRERRVGDRRGPPRPDSGDEIDPALLLDAIEDLVIELDEGDIEVLEQTIVRSAPR